VAGHPGRCFPQSLAPVRRRSRPGRQARRADLGEAFPAWQVPGGDAILQPPKPQITLSAKVLQLAKEHDTEPEGR